MLADTIPQAHIRIIIKTGQNLIGLTLIYDIYSQAFDNTAFLTLITGKCIIRYTVHIGFAFVIALMLLVVAVVLYQADKTNVAVSNLVQNSNAKIENAYTMRDAIRLRQISISNILASDDPFIRDEEIMLFYSYAGSYITARDRLLTFPMNNVEKAIHAELRGQANITQPITRDVAESLASGLSLKTVNDALVLSRKGHAKVLELINQLISLEKQNGLKLADNSRTTFEQSVRIILAVAILTITLSFAIAFYVSRYVSDKNQQLIDKNNELQKANVKTEQSSKTKSLFLANMSHEIRTPLSAIIGFSDLLQRDNVSQENKTTAVRTISRNSKHLMHLVNEILDVSKIEAQKIELEKIDVPVFSVIQDVEDITRIKVNKKRLYFRVDYHFPLPETIIGDPVRIRQILINICNNAVKFTWEGGITVRVSCDTDRQFLVFNVIDTGVGISNEKAQQLFRPFSQGDASITRQYGGTGLGLFLSRQLTEIMGGSINLKSEAGYGSIFTISLPTGMLETCVMIESESDIPAVQRSKQDARSGSLEDLAILLVEDNPDNQRLIYFYLSEAGAKVTVANDGQQALFRCRDQCFDIVLMDMQMPVMSGTEAVLLMKKEGINTPIISLTANATSQARNECLAAGCNDFITKPIDFDKLFRAITQQLELPETGIQPASSQKAMLDSDQGRHLVNKFIDSLGSTRRAINEAAHTQDHATLKDLFHQLKGVGGNIGFPEITQLAKEIEIMLANTEYDGIRIKVDEFNAICDRICESA